MRGKIAYVGLLSRAPLIAAKEFIAKRTNPSHRRSNGAAIVKGIGREDETSENCGAHC